jgi:ubiquinone/menaquinone biosynthesis C-methylase UbiE
MTEKLIRKYYAKISKGEWKRLDRDHYHQLEFNTTMHFLKKYLPKNGVILDAGGGPGRYAIELAKLSYDVILLDLTPELLETAKRQIKKAKVQNRVKQILQGSPVCRANGTGRIVDLSTFKDNTFDAVICLGGALSHIVNRKQREKAIDEFVRIAKNKASIFISVIGRTALLVTALRRFPQEMTIKNLFNRYRDTGNYYGGYGFTPTHFYFPEELRATLENRKLKIIEMVGLEGISGNHPKETNRLFKNNPEAGQVWWQTHLKTCTHPTAIGISEHFMIICRK